MKAKSTALFTLIMLFSMFLAQTPIAFAQSSSSTCTSADAFRFTMFGGVPSGFNHLTANIPGSASYYLEYQTLNPPPNPAGQQDNAHSVTDWISTNSNYTIWTFNVKPGLKWSDGTNVTSQDILNTMGPKFAFSPAYDFVNAHTEVAQEYAMNSSAAVYVLNKSDAHFAEKISDPVFVGIFPNQATSYGPNFTGVGLNTIGSGPYYVSNYTSGQTQAVFLRNPYYSPLPGPCEIIITYVETTSNGPTLLLAGSSDLALVDSADVHSLLQNPNLHLAAVPGHYETHLDYNVTWYPYNMTQFRQALVYGINQSAIIQQAFSGYGATAYNGEGNIPPISAAYSANQMNYSYNPGQALTLLKSIGFTQDSSGTLHYPNGTAVTLNLFADTSLSSDPTTADIIKTDLLQLGIAVNVNTVGIGAEIGGSYANAGNEQHSMLLLTGPGSDPGSLYEDGQPGWLSNQVPFVPGSTWEYPPSVQAEFQGNSSIVDSTNNPTVIQQALNNIQKIDAVNLPFITLAYPDETWVYNTQRWTNWGTGLGAIVVTSVMLNYTTIVNLQPASSSTSTGISPTSQSTTSGVSPTTAQSTTTNQTVTTSSSTSSISGNTYLYIGAAIIIIIIVAAGAYLGFRKKK
ncbi:MAG: ABC transporter substrate-binding protein [Nitrososphaerales archaeon]